MKLTRGVDVGAGDIGVVARGVNDKGCAAEGGVGGADGGGVTGVIVRGMNVKGAPATGGAVGILIGSGGGVFLKKCVVCGLGAAGASAAPWPPGPNGSAISGGGASV
ncbi:MAG: hypothetical protein ACREE6_09730, partial [Limisphaerales bacterium]